MSRIADAEICFHCAHAYDNHTHYRSGTDCGLCDCSGFVRLIHPWRLRLLMRLDRWWYSR